ncbi:unnamed protein product, partial [Polarella glacialis]
ASSDSSVLSARSSGSTGVSRLWILIGAGLVTGTGLAALLPLLRRLQRRRKDAAFEYGNVDYLRQAAVFTAEKKKETLTSLIPDSLLDLEENMEFSVGALAPAEEVDKRAQALAAVGAPPFKRYLKDKGLEGPKRRACNTLQLNIGLYCNQACSHCHVESSPLRKEMMTDDVVDRCLHLLRTSHSVQVLDITGGAPELNSGFKRLVQGAAELRDSGLRPELRIIDRCNLTVLLEPGQEELPDFLAKYGVDVIASLPSYEPGQTDKQRGRKVFDRSIKGLHILNSRGYGSKTGKLQLDLVFNPPGPFLPPKQELLEAKYKTELCGVHKVDFNRLITITNMPVKRYFDYLRKKGSLEGYMDLLVRNFNKETIGNVMCTDTVNVGWDGRIFDCDFNQQLELGLGKDQRLSVFDLDSLDDKRLTEASIRTAAHCFGCTAAQGSS